MPTTATGPVQCEHLIRGSTWSGILSGVLVISSRRRHTRLVSDWSSDVCSSVFCLRSEKHKSEVQSLTNIVCRLLLENHRECVSIPVTNRRTISRSDGSCTITHFTLSAEFVID